MTTQNVFQIAAAVIASLGGGSFIVLAASSWLGKLWAGKLLEKEKAAYALELERLRHTYSEEISRVQAELQKSAFEHQTRFSWYHQQKAELIANVYSLINEVSEHVREMVSPLQYGDDDARREHEEATTDLYNRLAAEFFGKKIFLEKELCSKIESILSALKEAISRFKLSQGPRGDAKLWGEAYNTMDKKVPPLLAELEQKFRSMLSSIGPA